MARRLISDDKSLFRVVIIARQRRDNPNWERGNIHSPASCGTGPSTPPPTARTTRSAPPADSSRPTRRTPTGAP